MKRAVALALLAMVYPLLGCRQVLDVDDFGTKPKYVGKTDSYTYVSRLCRDCVDEHCEEPTAACLAEPRCAAQAKCLALCGVSDHACRGSCSVSTPSTTAMAQLVTCQAEHCGASLPEEADRCGGSLALHGNAPCDQCLAGNPSCLRALEKVSRNTAALAYDRCRQVCTCGGECPDGEPGCECPADEGAMSPVSVLATCCASQCNGTEPDWSCLGRVVSPMTAAGPLELHLRATIPTDENAGVAGLEVTACSELTNECTLSAPATTNQEGWANLTIPRPPGRYADRYFGYLRLTSNEDAYRAPALFYFFPPIRETPIWVSRRMVARDLADAVVKQVPGLVPDWNKNGGIVFSARSCNDASGEGLQIISKSGMNVYYLSSSGGQVDLNATKTTSLGFGFIGNVEPGAHRLEARLPNGELVGEYAVTVIEGSLTHIVLGPTPLGDAQ